MEFKLKFDFKLHYSQKEIVFSRVIVQFFLLIIYQLKKNLINRLKGLMCRQN